MPRSVTYGYQRVWSGYQRCCRIPLYRKSSAPPAATRCTRRWSGPPLARMSGNHDTARGPDGPCSVVARSPGRRPQLVRHRSRRDHRKREPLARGRPAGWPEPSSAAVRVRLACHPADLPKGNHTASRGLTQRSLGQSEGASLTRCGRAGARSAGWHEGRSLQSEQDPAWSHSWAVRRQAGMRNPDTSPITIPESRSAFRTRFACDHRQRTSAKAVVQVRTA
jgi:hypothetical protein